VSEIESPQPVDPAACYGERNRARFPRIWPFSQGFGPVVCRRRAGLGVPYVSRWKSSQVTIRPSAAQAASIPSAAACRAVIRAEVCRTPRAGPFCLRACQWDRNRQRCPYLYPKATRRTVLSRASPRSLAE
jgi:hypothetical protein